MPGWGSQTGCGPAPAATFTAPTWLAAGQLPVAAFASGQSGTPAIFAATPFGRVTPIAETFCSPSLRARLKTNGA